MRLYNISAGRSCLCHIHHINHWSYTAPRLVSYLRCTVQRWSLLPTVYSAAVESLTYGAQCSGGVSDMAAINLLVINNNMVQYSANLIPSINTSPLCTVSTPRWESREPRICCRRYKRSQMSIRNRRVGTLRSLTACRSPSLYTPESESLPERYSTALWYVW